MFLSLTVNSDVFIVVTDGPSLSSWSGMETRRLRQVMKHQISGYYNSIFQAENFYFLRKRILVYRLQEGYFSWKLQQLKVNQFQNELMKSSFLPKYEQKIVKISALTTQGRNLDKRGLHKFILRLTNL